MLMVHNPEMGSSGLPGCGLSCFPSVSDDEESKIIIPHLGIQESFINITDVCFNVTALGTYFDGYNLFVLTQEGIYNSSYDSEMLIVDMEGEILRRSSLYFPVEWINSTTILGSVGELRGAVLWNLYTNESTILDIPWHHELKYNPFNDTVFALNYTVRTINGTEYLFDSITEYNMDGVLVWSLDVSDFISPAQWCSYLDLKGSLPDVSHGNSIFFDSENDVIYYNARNVNTFYKINHKTGAVIWSLGEYGSFTLFDKNGIQRQSLFYHAHAVEQVDESVYILFDNDMHNKTNLDNMRSRILEIRINETTMTANESWSWTAPADYYSGWYGDADRLPNGNRLAVFGTLNHNVPTSVDARLVEVDETGNIVWELNFPQSATHEYQVYRAERFRFSPVIMPTKDFATSARNVTLGWDVYYDSRPKRTMTGYYELLLDGELVSNGSMHFDKFWRSSSLLFNITMPHVGRYNVTLSVFDEGGHRSVDSLNVTVVDFLIERDGPLEVELGQESSNLTWFGVTATPLTCALRVNQTVIRSFVWTGQNITLDLQSLGVGVHSVGLVVSEDSSILLNDTVFVTVNSGEDPIVVERHSQQESMKWGEWGVLSWEVYDASTVGWTITANGSEFSAGGCGPGSQLVEYVVAQVDEGTYNFTFLATDLCGRWTRSVTWVTVNPPSPPVISSEPLVTDLIWGTRNLELAWEIHGGNTWSIWRNGTRITEQPKQGKIAKLGIEDWQAETWMPGTYNITLELSDTMYSSRSTVWIDIRVAIGDAYADYYVALSSLWFSNPNQALGPPDGLYAQVFADYGNGYLTLDMGFQEEIVNGEGDDFRILAAGGQYGVAVSTDVSLPFEMIGQGSGNGSFDLAGATVMQVRYVRVYYLSGPFIQLDAVVALHYNEPPRDYEAPHVSGIQTIRMWDNQSEVIILWEASDATPWNYKIFMNSTLVADCPWNGSGVIFIFHPVSVGTYNLTIVMTDLFGNRASFVSLIVVQSVPTSTRTATLEASEVFTVVLVGVASVGAASYCISVRTRSFHRSSS